MRNIFVYIFHTKLFVLIKIYTLDDINYFLRAKLIYNTFSKADNYVIGL